MKRGEEKTVKDVFYTILVAFAIISFWRGAWGLMDLYLFPSHKVWSFLISILVGIGILYSTENLMKRLI